MNVMSVLPSDPNIYSNTENTDVIEIYFKNFETLSKSERWEEIIAQGSAALETARKSDRRHDEARICAQLTSTAFYMGDFNQALIFANRCHEFSEEFEDSSLLIRALYLESAVHRALAAKEKEEVQQNLYRRAVEICEKAVEIYSKTYITNVNLKGKIYFNLGAAHADNPKGDLEQAKNCYSIAIDCFKNTNAADDIVRTSIRLGKIYLLKNNCQLCQQIINEARLSISNERISMHIDYLEAQLKLATDDLEGACKIARTGLEKAKALGAKEDEARLKLLLQEIESILYQ